MTRLPLKPQGAVLSIPLDIEHQVINASASMRAFYRSSRGNWGQQVTGDGRVNGKGSREDPRGLYAYHIDVIRAGAFDM